MPVAVMLDACVLYPLPLRDTLLRAAQQNLYAVRWSQRILDEVAPNLVKDRRATTEQARNLIDVMERAFEDAEVPEAAIASLEPAMTNEPADRHVLAAAVASDAAAIVTSNLRHFPATACEPFGIEVVHPDAFLRGLYVGQAARLTPGSTGPTGAASCGARVGSIPGPLAVARRRPASSACAELANGRCAATRGPRLAFTSARVLRERWHGWWCSPGAARGGWDIRVVAALVWRATACRSARRALPALGAMRHRE